MHGGGGGSGPTLQQQQLQTAQALTNANLNLEENSQRKAILNAMQGTRVFRGSALSRAVAGNTPGGATAPAAGPSPYASLPAIATRGSSLLDAVGTGATPAGGAGASGAATPGAGGGYRGPGQGANFGGGGNK